MPAASAPRLAVARPLRKTLRRESVQPGWIEAFEFTPCWPSSPAMSRTFYVDIGDRVKADQPLAELFLPESEGRASPKEAARAEALAQIELAAAAVRAAEAAVETAKANVKTGGGRQVRAAADAARWRSQYVRISQLVADGSLDRKLEEETQDSFGAAAEAVLVEVRAKVDAAKAVLLQSQADLAKAKAGQSVAQRRRQNAEADLSRVRTLLRYTQIRAPYDGVGDRAERQPGRFRPAGRRHDRQAPALRSPAWMLSASSSKSRKGSRLGLKRGESGYVEVRGASRPDRRGKGDADQLGLGRQSDLAHRIGPAQSQRLASAGDVRYRPYRASGAPMPMSCR